jgi:hypothetical protein
LKKRWIHNLDSNISQIVVKGMKKNQEEQVTEDQIMDDLKGYQDFENFMKNMTQVEELSQESKELLRS